MISQHLPVFLSFPFFFLLYDRGVDVELTSRAQLNSMIRDTLQSAADAWGMEVKRYEITEITPDTQISEAMDKQAAAERIRR